MRLIAFGCSNTFGDGLVDVYDTKNKQLCSNTPSKLAWPTHLGKLLDCQTVINKGSPGASAKEIAWHIQNFKFQKDDLVVVLWTHLERFCIIHEDNSVEKIGLWHALNNKTNKAFFKYIWNEHDMKVDMHIRIDYVKGFLDKKGIKNFHARSSLKSKLEAAWITTEMLKCSMNQVSDNYPKALDNMHPSLEAHEEFAKRIHKEIASFKGD